MVFQLIQEPSKTQVALAYTTALVLLLLVLVLFVAARIVGGSGPGRRQRRSDRRDVPAPVEPGSPFVDEIDLSREEYT